MIELLKINDACYAILGVVYFIRELLKIIFIIIPIVLIVMLSLDFAKGVISVNDKNKVLKIVIQRIIYAMIIFLIPSTVYGLFNILGVDSKDSDECWTYIGESNVSTIQNLSNLESLALEKRTKELQNELITNLKSNAIALSKSSKAASSTSSDSSTLTGSKSCSKKVKIRLTSFGDGKLRNSVEKNNIGTVNNNWKTYKYKGKKYLVIATAMENTDYKNSESRYNFKDYDILTLYIEGKKYDAIVLDVCSACAKYKGLKIDLWTTNDKQTWGDYQYLCTE